MTKINLFRYLPGATAVGLLLILAWCFREGCLHYPRIVYFILNLFRNLSLAYVVGILGERFILAMTRRIRRNLISLDVSEVQRG